ncbi:MAG: hypothetical protein Kow0059_05740 [Candidatus Sumerlaeia bacterium]
MIGDRQIELLPLIMRRVALELLRRKDAWVLLILMALFAAGVIVFRMVGIEAPATGTFLLNLGLTLAWFAAHLLTLLLAVRQIPEEIEQRTIYPLLARPLERATLLAGLWTACTASGVLCLAVLFAMAWLGVPKMEPYDAGLLAQLLALQAVSLAMMAALAMLASLIVPRGVALVALAALLVGGGQALDLLRERAAGVNEAAAAAVRWGAAYVPDFSQLNLITRYTDGIGPLSAWEFAGLAAQGMIFTAAALVVAAAVFRRRNL